ncbi:40S ribosomal protein [Mycena chlorophos]|uniref:40S ribosomal protein n=1 Tax=Mycena chlorophos TaxID=658473 RepID=A0A8H6T815_MYCCL|nr:40S ribosomal protein [Mycena chlorophos]
MDVWERGRFAPTNHNQATSAFAGMFIPLGVHLLCKAALNSVASCTLYGRTHLDAALDAARTNGLLTLANHISTLDDPVSWGALPTKYFLRSRTTRWTLGASDVMFTNPLFAAFFRNGQIIETFRGAGIYQPAVDTAIAKLDAGQWIHFFSEGKINQTNTYPQRNGLAQLPRFKWGVGRVLMETATMPVILPMWLSGFDQLMPEGRAFPYKYLPVWGQRLSVTFGPPIHLGELEALRRAPRETMEQVTATRIRITSILHDAVESLGRSISGDPITPNQFFVEPPSDTNADAAHRPLPVMSASSKILRTANAPTTAPDETEVSVAQALIDLENNVPELKAELRPLQISAAREVDVRGGKKAIVIFVPVPQLKAFRKVQQRLTRELEKKFSDRHVVFVAQRRMLRKPTRTSRVVQKRPRSRTLTNVHERILEDLVFPTEIVGKRTRVAVDGSKLLKVFLDSKDATSLEYKLDSFSSVYRRLTGKDVVFEFPVVAQE